jgi:thiol-disulfide isomerase/thioredoxin
MGRKVAPRPWYPSVTEVVMTRPLRAGVGVAVLAGILAGCARESNDTAGARPTGPATTPYPPHNPIAPNAGIHAGLIKPAGTVELAECRFDAVEAALDAARGKVVVVDCWALWCGPCLVTFPHLVQLHKKYADKGLVCMSVSLDNDRKVFDPDRVHMFLKEKGATFQNFLLTDFDADRASLHRRLGEFNGIPYMVMFGKSGQVVWNSAQRPLSDAQLRAKIETELAK